MWGSLSETVQKVWSKTPGWPTSFLAAHFNSTKTKRVIKVTAALTGAVALTLPSTFAKSYGENPFLLGTIAIYLFPIKSVGGQLIGSVIGLSGILFGLAYANLVLWLGQYMTHDSPEKINIWRHVFLWVALVVGAFGSGYLRSKISRSYLAINFFMVVNMFALIRGINHFEEYFHDFFYVMVIGLAVSLSVAVLLWPEDLSRSLEKSTVDGLEAAKSALTAYMDSLRKLETENLELGPMNIAERKLGALLHESKYELSLSRVDPDCLRPLYRCCTRFIIAFRVYNATLRRTRREPRESNSHHIDGHAQCHMDLNSERTNDGLMEALALAILMFDEMTAKVQGLYKGNKEPIIKHERLSEARELFSASISFDLQRRVIREYGDLQNASLTDQINNSVLEVLDIVIDMARAASAVQAGRYRIIIPKVLRVRLLIPEPTGHNIRRAASRPDAFAARRSFMTTTEEYLFFEKSSKWYNKASMWITEQFLIMQRSRHIKYAVKFSVAMGLLSLPAFISNWYVWYEDLRCQLAMISAMVAMETTQGLTFRTAGMKLLGALLGGLLAFMVVEISQGSVQISIGMTAIVGVIIGSLLVHEKWAKSGTVCALAYNLILGVAIIFPDNHVSMTFSRRLLTLPVGLAVATLVHIFVFPYHSRTQLVMALSSALDWMHHLIFAIEASVEFPHLERKFDMTVNKACQRLRLSRALLPATKYEVSLAGRYPFQRFADILEKTWDILDVIVGDRPCEPELSVHLDSSRACIRLRAKLLASLCNDLLVISHTLRTRLQMPRHESSSIEILEEFMLSLYTQVTTTLNTEDTQKKYDDVGRLADLVNEIASLRTQVDLLNQEIQSPHNSLLSRPPSLSLSRITRASTPAPV